MDSQTLRTLVAAQLSEGHDLRVLTYDCRTEAEKQTRLAERFRLALEQADALIAFVDAHPEVSK